MRSLQDILASKSSERTDAELEHLLSLTEPDDVELLRKAAFETTTATMGEGVYMRGLIEVSNICTANCRYCGIRKSNHEVERYTLQRETIIDCALLAHRQGYGSIAIQAGERRDPKWIDFISDILREIHERTVDELNPDGLGITLSLGEQTREVYARWAEAAGNPKGLRYLLRIESSNEELFNHLHSTPGKFEKVLEHRYRALADLRATGYQVGTGVMIGLPGQTLADLVHDVRTFEKIDADMIGMGPYITSHGGDMVGEGMMEKARLMQLALNMIAVTRLTLTGANIAAATALETLRPGGRVEGITYGCNVVMPNMTPQVTRSSYQLYDNKSGTEVGAEGNRRIEAAIDAVPGRHIGRNQLGSSRRWRRRVESSAT